MQDGKYYNHPHFSRTGGDHDLATIDQLMLHYLDIDSLIERSKTCELYQLSSTLNILSERYGLPRATTFKEFLKFHDLEYATTRSYFYPNSNPKEILGKAGFQGNILALYNGLLLHPKLRKSKVYSMVLRYAAKGNNEEIITLFRTSGIEDIKNVCMGAVIGGHLNLVKECLPETPDPGHLNSIIYSAAQHGQLGVLDYLLSLCLDGSGLSFASLGAGRSGKKEVIDYVLTKGLPVHHAIANGAASGNWLAIVQEYIDKPLVDYRKVFKSAIRENAMDVAKFIVKTKVLDSDLLSEGLEELNLRNTQTICYLVDLGLDNYPRLMELAAKWNNLELLSKFQHVEGLDYNKLFIASAPFCNYTSLKFVFSISGINQDALDQAISRTLSMKIINYLTGLGGKVTPGNKDTSLTFVKASCRPEILTRGPFG
jgi:hypothetical protein